MKCFYCESEILENEGMIYPLDKPYVNLRVHRICARAIDMEFLQKTTIEFWNISDNRYNPRKEKQRENKSVRVGK